MPHQRSFGIGTANEFFEQIVLPQYEDFLKNHTSPRYALLSVITAFHMYDWAFRKTFTEAHFKQRYGSEKVVLCNLKIAHAITNGTKHFEKPARATTHPKARDTTKTYKHEGEFSDEFSNEFNISRLVIERDGGSQISADELLASLISFWKAQQATGWP